MSSAQSTQTDSAAGGRRLWRRRSDATPLSWRAFRRSWQAYALLSPIFILLVIFVFQSPILGLVRAFFRWRPGVPATFVGLDNFVTYFTYAETPHELVNIVKLLVFGLFAGIVMPFIMAELIFFVRSAALKELYRLLVIIPMLVPGIVTVLLWAEALRSVPRADQ